MIKTISPYYKEVTWENPSGGSTPEKFILELYIWDGLKAVPPGTASYEIETVNPLGRTGSVDINVSRYVNDFIATALVQDTTTGLLDSDSQVWVKSQIIYYQSGVAQPAEFVTTNLALRGYGYGMEGKNPPTPTNGVLAHADEVKVWRQGYFTLPVFLSETLTTDINIDSYPDTNLTKAWTVAATTHSADSVQQVWIKISEAGTDDYIEISYNGTVVSTLLIQDEERYTPIDIFFANKEGQLSSVTFFKEKVDSLDVDSESYESSNGQPKDGVHQFKTFNKTGKGGYSLNSGFVSEDNNEIFRQLLLSDEVWSYDGTNYTPLIVKSSNIEYKSRQKDRLLNYKIQFEYAFNEINSI